MNLKDYTRTIKDFPKPGIGFIDVTPLTADAAAFKEAVRQFSEPYLNSGITKVVGVESRGFFFAPAVAYALNAGFVPIRKPGKLPGEKITKTYQNEYATDTIEMHKDALSADDKVLILDDVLATGGTAAAALKMVKSLGAQVEAFLFLLELSFLNGREKLQDVKVESLIKY